MDSRQLSATDRQALDEVLGYLNFSTGTSDRQFLVNINRLFRAMQADSGRGGGKNAHRSARGVHVELAPLLQARLDELSSTAPTFSDATQAREAIDLFGEVLSTYLEFHRDLLAHQDAAALLGPLFCGRAFEAILQELSHGEAEPQARTAAIVAKLNDYVGHRPLATLETRRTEPYSHEWHRPIPLYVRGVGAAAGRYEALLTSAIEILEAADPELLAAADFDPKMIEEVAVDARGYDFDHPVNKRPNYHFGHWDPHHIDSRGHYRRYVVRQEILDTLLRRVETPSETSAEALLFESAAALAGTMLMSAELSGSGPTAHTSDATLGNLMGRIAAHRDRFYEELLNKSGRDRQRLRAEAVERRQPFGGVRQYLNAELARMRAAQLEHVHLAQLFARIGQVEAASRQAAAVPTARARMVCQIQCLLTTAERALDVGEIEEAAAQTAEAIGLLHRAIECGAVVDPWNILGCDAQFSLFPALENSVHDHRVDELLELVSMLLETLSRGWTLAAAAGNTPVAKRLEDDMTALAVWWDAFATTSVSSVEGISAGALCSAAAAVAEALSAWHGGGATAGDVAFWRPYVARFDSPKAFVLVIDALLDRGDFVAAMALLMQWLSEADRVPLEEGDDSLHTMAGRWLRELLSRETLDNMPPAEQRRLVVRFFDSLEANADQWGQVPTLARSGSDDASAAAASQPLLDDLPETRSQRSAAGGDIDDDDIDDDDIDDDADEEDDLFAAAYDGMVYRDSSDDGVDENLMGSSTEAQATDHELESESRRVGARLSFLVTLAELWLHTAQQVALLELRGDVEQRLPSWLALLRRMRQQLAELLTAAARQPIPRPGGSSESLLQYDRLRWIKDALTEQVISTAVRCDEATLMVAAALGDSAEAPPADRRAGGAPRAHSARVLSALLRGDAAAVQDAWPQLLEELTGQPLLYVPLGKGGDPHKILAARSFQRLLRLLLSLLPRLGLLVETAEMLHLAGRWERQQGAAAGAVTEFDDLLKIANQAMADCVVASHSARRPRHVPGRDPKDAADAELIDDLDTMVQAILADWLRHSRNLRLSVLEKVAGEPRWQQLVELIQRFGADLFVQQFLHVGHLRAILHRGVEGWLEDVERQGSDYRNLRLVEAIREGTAPKRAAELLQLTLEAVVENYAEYRDYNSTTTQSDRGDMLYTLLDLLRLRVQYDRVDWNIAPVAQVHEVLVRHGRTAAAEQWRQELAERTGVLADELLGRLEELQRGYGMRLPTVADRLRERFVRPLMVDRARALLRAAIAEARAGEPGPVCAEFQQEVDELSREPTGVGLDVPQWLEALENEVEQVLAADTRQGLADGSTPPIPQTRLTRKQIAKQLSQMQRPDEA